MKKRRENFQKHLETLKETDPEKYKRVQNRIDQLKCYRQHTENNPQEAEEYLEKNQKLQRMIERHCWQTSDEL